MPVVLHDQHLGFPDPETAATAEGLVAIGGDARAERLLQAYSKGIFPWPHDRMPLLWFSPNPRFVLNLDRIHVPKRLKRTLKRGTFEIRADSVFDEVILACAERKRPDQPGTWITDELREGYGDLHRMGLAHSVEAFLHGKLVGGLYGVSLGSAFFGESMFALEPDASKVAFVTLLEQLRRWDFTLVDCQVETDHLARFGAENIPRAAFLGQLARALTSPHKLGPWTLDGPDGGRPPTPAIE